MELKNIKKCIVLIWVLATIDIILTMIGINNHGINYELNYFPKYLYSNIGIWYGGLIGLFIELSLFLSLYFIFKYFIKNNMESIIFVKPTLGILFLLYFTVNIIHLSWYI